jgi:hypothetical protein
MGIGLVFIYLAILLYGTLLVLLTFLAIYACHRSRLKAGHALLGLVGWLSTAPTLALVLFLITDGKDPRLGLTLLLGYLGTSPIFLAPLVLALRSTPRRLGPHIQPS